MSSDEDGRSRLPGLLTSLVLVQFASLNIVLLILALIAGTQSAKYFELKITQIRQIVCLKKDCKISCEGVFSLL